MGEPTVRHWLHNLRKALGSRKPHCRRPPTLELLEARDVPSMATPGDAYSPASLRKSYGFDQVRFGDLLGDGSGQTVAIVDCYDNPRFVSSTSPGFATSDLARFDAQFGLPNPPAFLKLDAHGGTNYPAAAPRPTDGSSSWASETAMDVEWVHALAPKANIVLVEAGDSSLEAFMQAVEFARHVPDVTVVSMSYATVSTGEPSPAEEAAYDAIFTTPAGHRNITFVAATGDYGSSAPGYPALSPNVVAVGGTTLTAYSSGDFYSETAWNDGGGISSGGGVSRYEPRPLYQAGAVSGPRRAIPDVAFDAVGVAVYDSYINGSSTPWDYGGGTSLSAPCWAALLAVANQGRAQQGQPSLDGRSMTLPRLYSASSADFRDVTSGSNGAYSAGPGYDLVTGRGTPIVNQLVPDLIDRPTAIIATGAAAGSAPEVIVRRASDGVVLFDFNAYSPGFRGGVSVAVGDITGDGYADIVTGAGPGGGPDVSVFDGRTGQRVREFYAYAANFRGGVNVAVGDVTGDGRADIVTGAGAGGGPHVRVFDGVTGAGVRDFWGFAPSFTGGVRVAVGDVTGDGRADVVTGAGPGGAPDFAIFDLSAGIREVGEYAAYAPGFRGGVYVAVGDVTGDGRADVITGAGPGGGPHVAVFDGRDPTRHAADFYAYDPSYTGGVCVAVVDINGDGSADILTTAGTGGQRARAFDGARPGTVLREFDSASGS